MGYGVDLILRAIGDKIFRDGKPVTALLDIGSHVTHISFDNHQENGIQIYLISQNC